MIITHVKTGNECEVVIERVTEKDYKAISKTRFYFDWKKQKDTFVYKLRVTNDNTILGLVSFTKHDEEQRIEINLLSVSKENRGKNKQYKRITGCLFAFVCRIAVMEYGINACVSLIPKTLLREHYIQFYGMQEAGLSVYLEDKYLLELLLKYEI